MMFRDQVGVLASWFKGWNECEQTVALLSLLKRVSRTQARFLQLCLEHSLAECTELQVLEGEANNPGEASVIRHRVHLQASGFCVCHAYTAAPATCPNCSKLSALFNLSLRCVWEDCGRTKALEVDAHIIHTST